ncbi:MAG: D-amino acid dehydrogenase [Sneathiella sp.]
MKIAVFGAGVTGVTTAYFLAKEGMDVTVFDRQSAAAEETSFANGGQISVSQPFPWSTPDLTLNLFKWLGRKDAPLIFRLQRDPFMWQWAIRFLANSRPSAFYANAGKIVRLALHSKECLDAIAAEEGFEFHHQQKGILKLFKGPREENTVLRRQKWLQEVGVEQRLLSRTECMEVEPALMGTRSAFTGGTYSPNDESGDAHQFTLNLVQAAKQYGAKFKYNTAVDGFTNDGQKITSVLLNNKQEKFDKFVLSSGAYSRFLAKKINVKLPIYPVKGYSVSLKVEGSNSAPLTSITDEANHVVISRLGDQIRAAGTAEINGYQLSPNKHREDMVLKTVMDLFPSCGDPELAVRWCGLRPMTTDSVPIIGLAQYDNFYTNTGHGPLGWTLSCGSAELLSSLIVGKPTKLDIADYSVDRFQ